MPRIVCQNENCSRFGESMDLIEEDSRQEYYIGIYCCDECQNRKEHRKEYDQNGLVIHDDVTEL